MSSLQSIPTIDLSLGSDSIINAICSGCSDWGFFYLTQHGIPTSDIDKMFAIAKTFFSQSKEDKAAAGPWSAETNSGFRPVLERV